ncbi:MAG: hypothetical protein ACM336_03485 [Acidobacteriota bacterium]
MMTDSSQILIRFDRFMRDVENGDTSRTSFRPWEVELLIDLHSCPLGPDRKRVLQRYSKAVRRGLERGETRPLRLSEYLARARTSEDTALS